MDAAMQTTMNRSALSIAVSFALFGASSVALAQVEADKPKAEAKPVPKVEEISVVAENPRGYKASIVQVGAFRDQNILEVPLTVNVIPRAVLDSQDSRGVYDALRNTGGVSRAQLSGAIYDNLSIRGVALQNRTNYRLNGSLPIINLIEMPMENKERVEALKGASSLYYGFTTPVGIINLVTKRARAEPNFSLALSGNEYGQFVQHIDAGSKFGADQQFGARVNIVSGKLNSALDAPKGERSLFALALDWRATDRLWFKFDYEGITKETHEPATIVIPAAVAGVIPLPRRPVYSRLIAGDWPKNDAVAKNALLRADYTISDNWYALAEVGRAQTRRDKRDYSEITNYNLVTGEGRLDYSLTRDLNFVNRNARVELGGKVALGFMTHDLTFGIMQNKLYQAGANSQARSVTQNLYDPRPIPFIDKNVPSILNPVNTTDKGSYAMDRITVGDFQLTIAVRKEDYEAVTTRNTTNPPTVTRYTASPTTYSYAGLYKVRKDTSIYASYIEGLEEGPIAPITAANAGAILPPAVSKQKEIGFKSEAIRGLLASIAYFDLERATSYTDANRFVVLDGRTRIKGVEFSFNGELTKEISLYASGMRINAKLQRAATAAITGKTPDSTPKETYSLLAEYKPSMVPGFFVNAGAYYTGRRFLNPANQAEISGYTILTAGMGYKTKLLNKPFSVQMNVANAADKDYWEAGGAGYLAVGAPRSISFVAKMDFF